MKTIKAYFIGSELLRNWLNNQASKIDQLEIVGVSDCAGKAGEEIAQLLPHVVIHETDSYEDENYSLLQKIKTMFPKMYYIVLGDTNNFIFRIKYSSAGANTILNPLYEMVKLKGILLKMGLNTSRTKELSTPDHLLISSDFRNKSKWNKYFSSMDEYPEGLMFADQDLVLRHLTPASVVKFSELEEFLPVKVENLVGQPLGAFHKKLSISSNIFSDPRNLPYSSQIIIGPKAFDLCVNSVYDESTHTIAGVIANWMELPGLRL